MLTPCGNTHILSQINKKFTEALQESLSTFYRLDI